MVRPLVVDLFCGAGGAGEGYRRAGFDVVGVDIDEHDYRPGHFVLADALDVLRRLARDPRVYGRRPPMPERAPIPTEPTGFGAIVRDVDGDHWARTREGRWLALIPGGGKRTWDDVAMHGPLTVVSEGVES